MSRIRLATLVPSLAAFRACETAKPSIAPPHPRPRHQGISLPLHRRAVRGRRRGTPIAAGAGDAGPARPDAESLAAAGARERLT